MTRSIKREAIRFLFAGTLNTILTYFFYLLLLSVLPYGVAYTLTYIVGIASAYLLACYLVFQERPRLRSALAFPGVYLVQYLLGVGLLVALVEHLEVSEVLAPLIVVAVTLPVTFLMSRLVVRRRGDVRAEPISNKADAHE